MDSIKRYPLSEVFMGHLNRLSPIQPHHSIVDILNLAAADLDNDKYNEIPDSMSRDQFAVECRRAVFDFGVAITDSLEHDDSYTPDALREQLLNFSTAARAELKSAVAVPAKRGNILRASADVDHKEFISTSSKNTNAQGKQACRFNAQRTINQECFSSVWRKWL